MSGFAESPKQIANAKQTRRRARAPGARRAAADNAGSRRHLDGDATGGVWSCTWPSLVLLSLAWLVLSFAIALSAPQIEAYRQVVCLRSSAVIGDFPARAYLVLIFSGAKSRVPNKISSTQYSNTKSN